MASTKSVTILDDNITLIAGAGDHTSSLWTLTDGYGGILYIKITNGATGPTIAAECLIQTSPDNSNWYDFRPALVSDLGNNIVSSWGGIKIDVGHKYIQVISGSNTDQNVTLRIEGTEVSAL